MRVISCCAALAIFAIPASPTEVGLPARVAERLDQAVTPSEPDEFHGRFTMSVATMVQKPNGKSREDVVFVADVVNADDGEQTRRLVRYIENNIDVTEEKREKFEKADGSRKKKDDGEDDSDFANPFGDTADLYRFGIPENLDSEVVVTFEPTPGLEDDHNVAAGRLAWDPATLEPKWLEMTAVHAPKPLRTLSIRLEFTPQGDHIFVSRMVTDGLARVLMIHREFHMDLRFDDIRPAGSIPP